MTTELEAAAREIMIAAHEHKKNYQCQTELGAKLMALREKAIADGMPLLSEDEIHMQLDREPDVILVPRNVLDEVIAELRHSAFTSSAKLVKVLVKIRDAQTKESV